MKKNTASVVWDIAQPIADELGLILWDVKFVKEGARWYLRITIDKEDGVSIDDCVTMHHAIDGPLDEADPIEQAYNLQVQSPGIERELKYPEHIDACEGWDVEVKLYAPRNGSKSFIGVLVGYDENGCIAVEINGERAVFKPEEIAKISTYYDFGK